jgi:competence protein ComEA
MRILNKLATKLGLTRSEVVIITVLVGGLFAGLVIKRQSDQKTLESLIQKKEEEFFTGTEADSLLNLEEQRYTASLTNQSNLNDADSLTNASIGNKRQKLNFNTTTRKELEALPGISPTLADRLIRFRIHKGGKLKQFEELLEVKDIGKKRLEKLTQYLRVE